jgi:hypothetical protein
MVHSKGNWFTFSHILYIISCITHYPATKKCILVVPGRGWCFHQQRSSMYRFNVGENTNIGENLQFSLRISLLLTMNYQPKTINHEPSTASATSQIPGHRG